MSISIPNTATTDAYKDWGLGSPYSFGSLTIANNPVTLILLHGDPALSAQTQYDYLTPRDLPLLGTDADPICGFRIKSAIAGAPAQYSGYLTSPNKAGLGGGQAFTQLVSAGGLVTNPPQSVVVTGRVNSDGSIAGGTGFSVVRNAAGAYTVTFVTAFAAVPVVVCNEIVITGSVLVPYFSFGVPTVNGFRVDWFSPQAAANQDTSWNFLAYQTS